MSLTEEKGLIERMAQHFYDIMLVIFIPDSSAIPVIVLHH